MSAYEPGTVALATVRGVPGVRVLRAGGPGVSGRKQAPFWLSAEFVAGWRTHSDYLVTDVRPLVVIDPEECGQVERVWLALRDGKALQSRDNLTAALRSLIAPPKPPEPTGLGAVVEDAEGRLWVRQCRCPRGIAAEWREGHGSTPATYADIDAARVLSEGVTP